MKDAKAMAYINLYAVLRNLEDLCEMDNEMKQLIAKKKLTLQLKVKNGPVGRFVFNLGKCKFEKGLGPADIKLSFRSPEHFNDMILGTAKPMITKGFTKLGFLTGDFMLLTERLGYYLKPTEALLKDPKYSKINTILSAYTAFFALCEIGNEESVGQLVAHRIPDGKIAVVVQKELALTVDVQNGKLTATKQMPEKFRASMTFDSLETAGALLNGKIDSYSCIASKKIELRGFIPMLDNMNKLLGQVSGYL